MRYFNSTFGVIAGVVLGLGGYWGVSALAQTLQQPVTTTTVVLNDGRTQLTIHNRSSVPMTAYAVDAVEPFARGTQHQNWINDSTLARSLAPISPGSDVSLIVAQAGDHPLVTFHAALFQDGSIYGETDWIQRLQNRRAYMTQALALAISDMQALAPTAESPADLAAKLDKQQQARIDLLPKATNRAVNLDNWDHVQAFRAKYPVVRSTVTNGLCSELLRIVNLNL